MRDPLWSNLPSAAREEADWAKRERTESVGEALYPRSQAAPASNNFYRESLLRNLRELNQKIDARLKGRS